MGQLLGLINAVDFQAEAFPQVVKKRAELNKLNIALLELNKSEATKDEKKETELKAKITRKQTEINECKVKQPDMIVIAIEKLIKVANDNNFSLCKNNNYVYLYNGNYWKTIDSKILESFLGEVAEKMGFRKYSARSYQVKEQLFKQFISSEYRGTPEPSKRVLINLRNSTFEIKENGSYSDIGFNKEHFLTYQLSYPLDINAEAPIFKAFLNKCLPDIQSQKVLQEYIAYIFIPTNVLKLEKALILYGGGANGKSVFNAIVTALLGTNNVSSYTPESLTDPKGYQRAAIQDILLNYASEISGKLNPNMFKALISGEPVEARLPYGNPFIMTKYAKLLFNCNELPKDVEHTHAYFRRLLIIPFNVTIAEGEQDKQLHKKIIDNELAGVFNWVLEGLNRLLDQKAFSECEAADKARDKYKIESDSVLLFIEEEGFDFSETKKITLQDLYQAYKTYCCNDGIVQVKKANFKNRLAAAGKHCTKENIGNVYYMAKKGEPPKNK